jgi:cation diffusion facilitator CzcD-associated flavoprotein CzcO
MEHVRIAVIGTGFAGLGAAIKLKESGREDFVVLEKASEVGGTWRDNTYPGCQCDVPSKLYQFSFAQNPSWSRAFSPQPEILEYIRGVADSYGLRPHIRFGCGLEGAAWDESARVWRLETTGGSELSADIVISGVGSLSIPAHPDIPGLAGFEGAVMHSAEWDASYDFAGKRVAAIGTGASAIQFVPRLQREVAHLDLYQRTPPWILPHPDRPITDRERKLFRRAPFVARLMRSALYWGHEAIVLGFTGPRFIFKAAQRRSLAHIRSQISDPELRAKVTPAYEFGCKRILLSSEYYPALASPNVDVLTDGVAEIRANSVVDAAGVEREVDAIVLGTGFHVTDFPPAQRIRGRDGSLLAEQWRESGMSAYLGTTVHNLPNFFFIVGPNTGLGHTSMTIMIEAQIAYVMAALDEMDARRLAEIEVREDVETAYTEEMRGALAGTAWGSGCRSWYLDGKGRNVTLWPSFTFRFRNRTATFDAGDYVTRPVSAEPEPEPERVAA